MEQDENEDRRVVAVTRQGWGDCWLFTSTQEADEHPLVQYGDAIVAGPDRLLAQYSVLELPRLMRMLKVGSLADELATELTDDLPPRKREQIAGRYCERVWSRLVAVAKVPPSAPARVVELIRADRIASKERAMAEKAAAAEKAAKTAKATKDAAAPTAGRGRVARYADGDKIYLENDPEGKPYGAKNNPKRAGSNAAADFEKYKNGMTFKALVEALGSVSRASGDLRYNQEHGYVRVEKAPEKAAA